jgi:hypothetical protein
MVSNVSQPLCGRYVDDINLMDSKVASIDFLGHLHDSDYRNNNVQEMCNIGLDPANEPWSCKTTSHGLYFGRNTKPFLPPCTNL